MNKPTPGKWRFKERTLTIPHSAVYGPPHPIDGGDYAPIAETSKADGEFIVAAVNLAFEVNPDDPTAALNILRELWKQHGR